MDGFLAALWILRIAFLVLLYAFLFVVVRMLVRDLRAAAREPGTELGRLLIVASPSGDPPVGSVFSLDAITTIGRDVNNSIVFEDEFASTDHASLTYRGRAWYVEDLGSTNGTFLNGSPVVEATRIGYGDEIQVGQVRARLDRGRR